MCECADVSTVKSSTIGDGRQATRSPPFANQITHFVNLNRMNNPFGAEVRLSADKHLLSVAVLDSAPARRPGPQYSPEFITLDMRGRWDIDGHYGRSVGLHKLDRPSAGR
jgi:hypothetical protein